MEAEFTINYDSQGRVTKVTYKNDRTEDPDGRTQIELLEMMSVLGLAKREPTEEKKE